MEKYNFNWVFSQRFDIKYVFYFFNVKIFLYLELFNLGCVFWICF